MSKRDSRAGRPYRRWKQECFARDRAMKARCRRCRQPIDYTIKQGNSADPDQPYQPDAYEPDHIKSWHAFPALRYIVSNGAPSHAKCNRSGGDSNADADDWHQAEDWVEGDDWNEPTESSPQQSVFLPYGGSGERPLPFGRVTADYNLSQSPGCVVEPYRPDAFGPVRSGGGGRPTGPP